ncbi:uncharacterized protein [Medicago truncatula]|uniref:uncharacterized protein n=1 Tax=Medicago truncatula TaxID=3880 RepID=UPI0019672AF2|nr:uncharacterized protein LOC120580035 [Medicago truncatula]
MASTEPNNDFLAGAKDAVASAQTTVGNAAAGVQTTVGNAAANVQKTVGEYATKAADFVQSKPEEPAKPEGVIAGAKNAVGGLFKK